MAYQLIWRAYNNRRLVQRQLNRLVHAKNICSIKSRARFVRWHQNNSSLTTHAQRTRRRWPHYAVFAYRFNRFPFPCCPKPTSAGRLLILAASLSLAPDRTPNIRPVCALQCDKNIFLFCAPNTDVGYTPLMCTVITVLTLFRRRSERGFPLKKKNYYNVYRVRRHHFCNRGVQMACRLSAAVFRRS